MTRKPSVAPLLCLALAIGWAPAARAGNQTMLLGPVAVGTGSVTCYALNTGPRSIERVMVRIWSNGTAYGLECRDLRPSASYDSLCSRTVTDAGDYWCEITIIEGRKKGVIGRLGVEDSSGNTILSLGTD